MEELPTNSFLDDVIVSLLEKIEKDVRKRLEKRIGLQLLDHQFLISLTWNEKEQRLDLDIDAEVEVPPLDQNTLQQVLDEILQIVVNEHQNQLQIIVTQLKTTPKPSR